MKKKIYNFFHGELLSSICFLLIGLGIFFFPTEVINIICKVVFSLVLIAAGLYYLIRYISEKKDTTMLDMFTGVIVLVIGSFLFENPQIAVKLMPRLLGAMVVIDTAWVFRAAKYFKKEEKEAWKAFFIVSLLFSAAGVAIMIAPFKVISQNMIFAGSIFIANGIADIVFYIMNAKRIRDTAKEKENPKKEKEKKDEEYSRHFDDLEEYEEYDPSYAEQTSEKENNTEETEGTTEETEKSAELPGLPDKKEDSETLDDSMTVYSGEVIELEGPVRTEEAVQSETSDSDIGEDWDEV